MEQRFGGSFAPPIGDEQLSKYREVLDLASPPVREEMVKLLRAVEAYRELPPQEMKGTPHPSGAPNIAVALLSKEHVSALDEHVPWDHEIAAAQGLFDSLDLEACARNSALVEGWQRAVSDHFKKKHFPEQGLWDRLTIALRTVGEWLGILGPEEQARIVGMVSRRDALAADINEAMRSKSCEAVPYPELEPTPVRDAAFHLLWYAKELSLDRHPMTSDRLV